MQRWLGKIGVVTGCCAGIGAATTIDLVKAGMVVVGLDLQPEKMGVLKSHLPQDLHKNLHVMKCNVAREPEIVTAFGDIERNFGGVDVLVNNAGVLRTTMLIEPGNTKALKESVDVNVMGLVFCSREAIQLMRQRTDDGHIVLINSILGHRAPMLTGIPSPNIYAATKHAVTAILETLRQELISVGSNIKLTSISPGMVKTELFPPEMSELWASTKQPYLTPHDVSQAIMYALSTPPRVQVYDLCIRPMGELL